MINKDKVLLEAAYLSATNKLPETPADKAPEHDTNSDIESSEEPMVISIGGPVDDEVETEESEWEEHENEETRMAKTNLYGISEDSKLVFNALEGGEEVEPWMLQKIAVAAEMISGVAKVVRYCAARTQAGVE
jgi:hypothetical protein